jgi:hypothetical protein
MMTMQASRQAVDWLAESIGGHETTAEEPLDGKAYPPRAQAHAEAIGRGAKAIA